MNMAFLLALIGIGYPLIGGLGLLWAYKTVTSKTTTYPFCLGVWCLVLLISIVGNLIGFPLGTILGLLGDFWLISGMMKISFGKGALVWVLGFLYTVLLSLPFGLLVAWVFMASH